LNSALPVRSWSTLAPTAFDDAQIAAALQASGAGYLADDTAMISATWIKATVPLTAVWLEGFGAMLSFAESRGWLADGGLSIRAHIERSTVNRPAVLTTADG
jgi:hypothetical protein